MLTVVSCSLKILELKVNDSDLAICLVVLGVIFDYEFVMNQCFFVLIKLMQDLTETEVSWNAVVVKLDAVSEGGFGLFGVCLSLLCWGYKKLCNGDEL